MPIDREDRYTPFDDRPEPKKKSFKFKLGPMLLILLFLLGFALGLSVALIATYIW